MMLMKMEKIDIVTMEKDTALSDSDIFEEKISFLPATNIQDVPKQQDNFLESSLNLVNNNNTISLLSHKVELDGKFDESCF